MRARPRLGRAPRLAVFIVPCVLSLATPADSSAQSAAPLITLGEAHIIDSAVLDEERQVLVALPESYDRSAVRYPVLYLLDGDSNLLHAIASIRFLADARDRAPEMIVVAIPNRARNRDLTPGTGAATFQRFLGDELIPWVERTYRAAPERVLMGHSLSGSFVVHTLLNRPELFDLYVAASAPVWRYDGLAQDVEAGARGAAAAGASLYLTVGEHENERLRAGVAGLAAMLEELGDAAPAWSYHDLPDEDHSSTSLRTVYDALEARYAEWRFPFFEDAAELSEVGGREGLEAHYERFSAHFGYDAPPPEGRLVQVARLYIDDERYDDVFALSDAYRASYPLLSEQLVNAVGYARLGHGETDQAVRTFQANVERFPDSPNVHDSLGDGYCAAGDTASARASYGEAARLAERESHPRLAYYRANEQEGCDD